jgi:hypothetical protein
MPNIIEQQDLLKGLPDNRLALLLQQPTGDIPPFLVAAEAQRRQSIRAQFSGNANNESVVDSLTKQLVPQNIQAPVNAPPQIPPTPPMAGVAALQQQQAMQQAAMNAQQPQQMRAGGAVRRFNEGGLSITDMYPQARPFNMPRVQPIVQSASGFAPSVSEFSEFGPMPGAPTIEDIIRMDDEETKERREDYAKRKEREDREKAGLPPLPSVGLSADEIARENQLLQQRLKMQEQQRSGGQPAPLNDNEPLPGETEDDFRARIEALYSGNEPSDWEKAQRWFAMSEQFLDPSKTNMQSIAGAGRAFAEQSAAMDAGRRQSDVERQKALLEWDINERNRTLDAESRMAQREYDSQLKREERKTLSAGDASQFYGTQITALLKAMDTIDEDPFMPPEQKSEAKGRIQEQIDAYRAQAAMIMKSSGYDTGSVITIDQLRQMAGS